MINRILLFDLSFDITGSFAHQKPILARKRRQLFGVGGAIVLILLWLGSVYEIVPSFYRRRPRIDWKISMHRSQIGSKINHTAENNHINYIKQYYNYVVSKSKAIIMKNPAT